MKLKDDKSRLNCSTHPRLWHLLTLCHNQLQKVNVVHLDLHTFMFYSYFFFWGILFFLSPLIVLLGLLTLFLIFYLFFIFLQNMRIQLVEGKVCTYLQDYHYSSQNYESYIYRSLTSASLGVGISWWNVKKEIGSLHL